MSYTKEIDDNLLQLELSIARMNADSDRNAAELLKDSKFWIVDGPTYPGHINEDEESDDLLTEGLVDLVPGFLSEDDDAELKSEGPIEMLEGVLAMLSTEELLCDNPYPDLSHDWLHLRIGEVDPAKTESGAPMIYHAGGRFPADRGGYTAAARTGEGRG